MYQIIKASNLMAVPWQWNNKEHKDTGSKSQHEGFSLSTLRASLHVIDVTCHVCRVRANDYRLINNQSNNFDRRSQFKAVPLHNSLFDEGCTDMGNRGLKTRKFWLNRTLMLTLIKVCVGRVILHKDKISSKTLILINNIQCSCFHTKIRF